MMEMMTFLTNWRQLAVVCVVLVLDVVVHLVAVSAEASDGYDVLVAEVQTLDGPVLHVGPGRRKMCLGE